MSATRREFMKTVGATAAGVTLPALSSKPSAALQKTSWVAVVGAEAEPVTIGLTKQLFFDDHVIEIFYDQTLDSAYATRHNIRSILIYQYKRLARRLSHPPTKQEIDRNCVIGSDIYITCFGSWKAFEETIAHHKGTQFEGFDLGNW